MKPLISVTRFLIALSIPLFLLTSAIRIVFITPFMDYEYNRPGFPPDQFGFSTADRMKYGKLSLDYLFTNAGIDTLANAKLADGSPLYNERELSHMADVKTVLHLRATIWWISLAILVLGGLWAWRAGWLSRYFRSISTGGWVTLGLVAAIFLGVVTSFDWFFTQFHHLFFKGDTWLFNYSDSLIRLFPIPLWQDGFIAMGVLTVLFAILLTWGGYKLAIRIK